MRICIFDFVLRRVKFLHNRSYQDVTADYDDENPEFRDFRLYLTEKEMNSLRWNKEKMMKTVKDKKKLQQAFKAIYNKGEFISDKDLKLKLAEQFKRLGILLSPKATQIKDCSIYKVERCSQYIDGKKVNGYRFGDTIFDYRM